MSEEGKKSVGAQVAKGGLYGILFLLVAFILLVFLSAAPYLIQMVYHLLCGWVIHAWKALPPFFEKWQTAVLPLGCLLMAFVLAHRFIRRWVAEKRPALDWRIRHTAAVFSLILLVSAAAIASSGIVHQFFWLGSGKVIESNRRTDLTIAMSSGRQLMIALWDFQIKKGRYPYSFEELEKELGDEFYIGNLTWLDFRDGQVPEPWVLLQPGSADTALVPVIVSPLIAARGMVVVGYSDTSVKMIRAENLTEVLVKARTDESEGGR